MPTTLWNLNSVMLRGSARPRLDQVTCSIESGVTAVLGSSGAGKTSLLNVLAGLESPDSGTVEPHIAPHNGELPLFWAPQGGGLWPHLTVRQHLTEVGKDEESADNLLTQFDLQERQSAFPGELSQGERARTAIARALAVSARVLLFDEPLVHVDGPHKAAGWQIIRNAIRKAETHLVLTTHEPDVVLREADSVLCLADGRLVWSGGVRELYAAPPSDVIGRFLGPLNWFDIEDQQHWLAPEDRHSEPRCIRPEQLWLQSAQEQEAACEVIDTCFMGDHAETILQRPHSDHTRTVLHRPASPPQPGSHVTLTVLDGCADAGDADV